MRLKSIAIGYTELTPAERFRLVVAAHLRGDTVEQSRIARSGKPIVLSVRNHAPLAEAYNELALHIFIEILDHAARFEEAATMVSLARASKAEECDTPPPDTGRGELQTENAVNSPDVWAMRYLYAAGYMLRTNVLAWQRFCESIGIPPFVIWEKLPGYDRLQSQLSEAADASFTSEEFVRWLNESKPPGIPEQTENPYTPETLVRNIDDSFQYLAQWCSGRIAAIDS